MNTRDQGSKNLTKANRARRKGEAKRQVLTKAAEAAAAAVEAQRLRANALLHAGALIVRDRGPLSAAELRSAMCVHANRKLTRCACFKDVVLTEGKEMVKRLMRLSIENWRELSELPA